MSAVDKYLIISASGTNPVNQTWLSTPSLIARAFKSDNALPLPMMTQNTSFFSQNGDKQLERSQKIIHAILECDDPNVTKDYLSPFLQIRIGIHQFETVKGWTIPHNCDAFFLHMSALHVDTFV